MMEAVLALMFSVFRKLQFLSMLIGYTVLATAKSDTIVPAGYNDLLLHFVGYLVLFNSGLFAFGRQTSKTGMFILLFAYSLLIELVQFILPYRTFSLMDLLANALGLCAGLCIGTLLIYLLSRYENRPGYSQ